MNIQQIIEQQERYEQAFNQLRSDTKELLNKNTEDLMNASRKLAAVTTMSIEEAAHYLSQMVSEYIANNPAAIECLKMDFGEDGYIDFMMSAARLGLIKNVC